MSKILTEIVELKKKRLAAEKAKRSFEEIKSSALKMREISEKFRLSKKLQNRGINIIAEIKRASPSKGVINDNFDVREIARIYEENGAAAISVLTEEDKFSGSLEDLKTVRESVSSPILRKDFIFDEFQIYESAEAGADVILLIAAMLDDENLQKLFSLSQGLGLDALIEVHNPDELERAEKINPKIIGVNNRNLQTFTVSLDVSRKLIKHAPKDFLLISESGISAREEILELRELGFSGFLIGETLMRSSDPAEEFRKLNT